MMLSLAPFYSLPARFNLINTFYGLTLRTATDSKVYQHSSRWFSSRKRRPHDTAQMDGSLHSLFKSHNSKSTTDRIGPLHMIRRLASVLSDARKLRE